jgi:hypothetical protein
VRPTPAPNKWWLLLGSPIHQATRGEGRALFFPSETYAPLVIERKFFSLKEKQNTDERGGLLFFPSENVRSS